MKKCDFCIMSDPSGKCFYLSTMARKSDCEKAIKQMAKALQGTRYDKRERFNENTNNIGRNEVRK